MDGWWALASLIVGSASGGVLAFSICYCLSNNQQRRHLVERLSPTERRALTLLNRHLTPEQRKDLKKNQQIGVQGGISGRQYIIPARRGCLVNCAGHQYCLVVGGYQLVWPDEVLAKKLLIESNEKLFLETAIKT